MEILLNVRIVVYTVFGFPVHEQGMSPFIQVFFNFYQHSFCIHQFIDCTFLLNLLISILFNTMENESAFFYFQIVYCFMYRNRIDRKISILSHTQIKLYYSVYIKLQRIQDYDDKKLVNGFLWQEVGERQTANSHEKILVKHGNTLTLDCNSSSQVSDRIHQIVDSN